MSQREDELSKRQRECLEARKKHFSAKETGQKLRISPHTVAMHLRLARLKTESKQPNASAKWNRSDDPTYAARDEGSIWVFAAIFLIFGVLSAILTVAGVLLLRFSPWFEHLRQ